VCATPKRWQHPWTVVTCVAAIGFVIPGAVTGVIGTLLSPLMKESGWSSSLTSSLLTAYTVAGLSSTPAVGFALDALGPRAVMAFGALGAAMGLFWASRCHSWSWMLGAFACAGIGFNASFYLPSTVIVTSWMSTQKGLGMGIVMGAMSAGAALFSPLIGWGIERYGWRPTVAGIAALIMLMLPLILLTVRTNPRDQPERARSPSATHAGTARQGARAHRRDLLSRVFLLALASGVLFSIGMQGIYYHLVPLLIKAGFSAHWAGMAFGGTWLLSSVGSLVLGVIADRVGAKRMLVIALLCSALGTLFLLEVREGIMGIACVAVFVLLWGASANGFGQLTPVIFAERLGARSLGTLVGVLMTLTGIAGAAAPMVAGWLYDEFGDYRWAVALCALATFLGGVFILLVDRRHGTNRAPAPDVTRQEPS
jgi:MFS family permease